MAPTSFIGYVSSVNPQHRSTVLAVAAGLVATVVLISTIATFVSLYSRSFANEKPQPYAAGTNTLQTIYSDTAMAPQLYYSASDCQKSVRAVIAKVAEVATLVFKSNPEGVHYLRFNRQSNNYVLRCFEVAPNSHRLFIFGSGADKDNVSLGVQRFYQDTL